MTQSSSDDRLRELREELTRREAEFEDLRASMPQHSVRVHQQLALEDAEEDVRRIRAEIAALEGEPSARD